MKNRLALLALSLLAVTPFLACFGATQDKFIDSAPEVSEVPPDGIEPLLRGPIHEAFAQPFEINPEPGEAVPKAPPDPIPELPPEERPEGDDLLWIPGYWAWDAAAGEFQWVSGVYRRPPEGRV